MSHHPRLTVEEIVAIQMHYVKVCEEQSEAFRMDPVECQKAYDSYMQTEDVAKVGQSWVPSEIDRSAYILEMEARCKTTPTSFYDRVKIYFAAHAILACVVTIDSCEHPQADQLRILAEVCENFPSGIEVRSPFPKSLTRLAPTSSYHEVTDKMLACFREDPTTLLGKQFIEDEDNGGDEGDINGLPYQVIEVGFTKGGGNVFHVQFEDCIYCVDVDSEEMLRMLERSTFIEVLDDGTAIQET